MTNQTSTSYGDMEVNYEFKPEREESSKALEILEACGKIMDSFTEIIIDIPKKFP